MTATVKVGPSTYTVVTAPSLDSRGNWICPTYTINGQTYNFPQDRAKATPVFQSIGQVNQAVHDEARRVISVIQ